MLSSLGATGHLAPAAAAAGIHQRLGGPARYSSGPQIPFACAAAVRWCDDAARAGVAQQHDLSASDARLFGAERGCGGGTLPHRCCWRCTERKRWGAACCDAQRDVRVAWAADKRLLQQVTQAAQKSCVVAFMIVGVGVEVLGWSVDLRSAVRRRCQLCQRTPYVRGTVRGL